MNEARYEVCKDESKERRDEARQCAGRSDRRAVMNEIPCDAHEMQRPENGKKRNRSHFHCALRRSVAFGELLGIDLSGQIDVSHLKVFAAALFAVANFQSDRQPLESEEGSQAGE